MKDVRITVIKKDLDQDLINKYMTDSHPSYSESKN